MRKPYEIGKSKILKCLIVLFVVVLAVVNVERTYRNLPVPSTLDFQNLQLKYKQYI